MDEIAPEYDAVVLGTGLTECVLSGVLSVKGNKVLHIDRNDHYGGEAASVNIEALFKKYGNVRPGEEPWKKYGRVNDWNIDLVPKLLMSNGELTNILVSTDVTRYLEFKQIAGSYVQQGKGPKATVAKVPSDAGEALRSSLMGLFESDVPRSSSSGSVISRRTTQLVTRSGAAVETINRIRLYVNSMARYGKSPNIYPLYGLGELPEGFARLSAIYGGTYMLNTDVDEVLYENGKVSGIKATMKDRDDQSEAMKFETKTKKIIADPSYFPSKSKTDSSDSAQLIIPQSQVGRKHDIYIAMVSSAHNVCPKGYYIAIVSTIAENDANHHLELEPGFERLGKIERNDVRDMYCRATGEELKVEGLREDQQLATE
ncbi:GDP dissociation inhibitor [Penicillium chrysogenum]|nr:GDP dissociation inhibitor [Penicillium chrysogenum]